MIFFKNRKNVALLCFFGVVIANLVVYWPSLFHMPRSDQWWYLLNTAGKDNFFVLARDYYSYNRVKVFLPQDVMSFSPLWFIFCALEKSLFGNNFVLWQATGIVLHLAALWLLFSLVDKLQRSLPIAVVFTLFFSFIFGAQEMVIWHHINPYLIFYIFVLLVFHQVHDYDISRKNEVWRIAVIFFTVLFAVFIRELGLVLAILVFGFMLYRHKKNPYKYKIWFVVLCLVPVILYLTADYYDYISRNLTEKYPAIFLNGGPSYLSSMGTAAYFFKLFGVSLHVLVCLVFIPLFPAFWFCDPLPRLTLHADLAGLSLFTYISSLLIFGLLLLFFVGAISFKAAFKNRLIVIFSLITLCSHILIAGITRFMRGGITEWISTNVYYFYEVWGFLVIILALLVDRDRITGWAKGTKIFFAAVFIVATFYSGWRVYSMNMQYKNVYAAEQRFMSDLSFFVSRHRAEKDFSFMIIPPAAGDVMLFATYYERTPDGSFLQKGYYRYASNLLFTKYINEKNPKYIVEYRPGMGVVSVKNTFRKK